MNLLKNQRIADSVSGLYQDLEEQLMANIIRHCRDYGEPIDSDEWQMQKLAEIGKLNKENLKIIAKASGLSYTAMLRMLEDMAEEVIHEQLEPGFSSLVREGLVNAAVEVGKSKNIKKSIDALEEQSKDTLNKCNTMMLYKARDAYKKLIQDTVESAKEIESKQIYVDVMNKGAVGVVTGAQSRQEALRKTIHEFNEKGIPAFVDSRGREWTPEAYVNMAMRNTVRNVADQIQEARCRDYGINLVSIDAHSGARPKCAKDQGKIFDLNNGKGTTEDLHGKKIQYYPWNSSSYGEPDGLLGINCGHHRYPFIPGVNIQRYFPTDDLDANNKLYKQTQVQRALERDVRKQKRECMLLDQLDDTEAFEKASVKLKEKEARLKEYVDKNPELHRRKDREQVVGFDKGVSARVVASNKAYAKAQKTDTIPLKDTIIHKSVGAKYKNYKVVDKATGIEYEFAPGTRIQNSEVFAGKGTRHPLHEGVAEGLTAEFGGNISKWQHAKGNGILLDDMTGEEYPAEVHWFQEESVGKVKFKVKRWLDEG